MKNGFKQYIDDQAKWIADAETKRLAREKVDELSSAIGYASIASDDTQLDVYYAKVNSSLSLTENVKQCDSSSSSSLSLHIVSCL